MNAKRLGLCGVLFGLLAVAGISRADDIDIYSGIAAGGANAANLMFIIDNSANSDASFGSCAYDLAALGDGLGGAPSNGSKTLGNEQCALVNIAQFLPTRTVTDPATGLTSQVAIINLGIATSDGVYFNLLPIDDNAYTGPATTGGGTNIAIPGGLTNRQAFVFVVKQLPKHTGSVDQGDMMQETWAYYTGGNGPTTVSGMGGTTATGMISLTHFPGTNATTGCQKNYAIFLGATASSSHVNDAGNTIAVLTSAVTNYEQSQVAAGNITQAKANANISALTAVIVNGAQPDKYASTPFSWAREWARFMASADINTGATGTQAIITYSISVGGGNADMANFTADMANFGGGKPFTAATYAEIYNSILKILNEVQAVNSVFSSSSLPVSVNAQGTFLNQIYMGMFRPDANGNPRWMGNLKQYQFILNVAANSLQLGDSLGNPALSSAGTGFISPNAISFWSCTDLASAPYPNPFLVATPAALTSAQIAQLQANAQSCPDPGGGFWVNDPNSLTNLAQGFDVPDGERVERGGTAQQIRNNNLTDNYTTSPAAPRKLYTYCPSGTGCIADLSDAANAFATSNTDIVASMFGTTRSVQVSSITRSGTAATVATTGYHEFMSGESIDVENVTPNDYEGLKTITVTDATHFTYPVAEYPPTPASGSYTSQKSGVPITVTSLSRTGNTVTAVTPVAHGFPNGTTVIVSGAAPSAYNGSFIIDTSGACSGAASTCFYYTVNEQPPTTAGSGTATSVYKTTGSGCPCSNTVNINAAPAGITRSLGSSTVTVTTGTNVTTGSTGWATGRIVTLKGIVDSTGAPVAAYNGSFTISSLGVPNNNAFTITVPVSPATPAAVASGFSSITASLATALQPITSLTRADIAGTTTATVTATTAAPHGYATGNTVSIGGTAGPNESPYLGNYTITVLDDTNFTYTINTTPASPASALTGATMTATRSTGFHASDMTNLMNWVRGQDNMGDERGPGGTVTIRPSVHGDVLHSRPVVLNYGSDPPRIVVFYGDNGGVFHAVNGSQTSTMFGVGPGDEIWGFIPKEFFTRLNRQRGNTPQLNLPSTPPGILPAPTIKDYFVDGQTGVYQVIDGNGITTRAILYLSMRRGGPFIYALDVTNPLAPTVLWKVDNTSPEMGELGQTWSQPQVARVAGQANPVLIFGGGYNTNEDSEPIATADSSGRAIFVLDAFSGNLVWSARYSCTGITTPCITVPGMNYSIPGDITLVDRDFDGWVDRLYAGDTGGNLWRVDLEPGGNSAVSTWQVNHLAALGCYTGACGIPSVPTQRKFFFPPEVIFATSGHNYDAVVAGSGDREHPLYVSTSTQRYNRLFLVKDIYTGNDATGMLPVTIAGTSPLFDATSTPWDGTLNGYFITLGPGEKVVNAPLAVAGKVYMSTNTPAAPSANSCTSNLGTATGYQLTPYSATYRIVIFNGGGLPPSPVAGVVNINVGGQVKQVPFIIGGANPDCTGSDCKSPLGGQIPPITVPTTRNRTYWYNEGK